jgi:hypothetical protein
MKKLILLIAIVFTTSNFASNSVIDNNKILANEKSTEFDFKPCPIKIKGTYDGKEINITVTVEAENCAKAAGELLKEFTKSDKK